MPESASRRRVAVRVLSLLSVIALAGCRPQPGASASASSSGTAEPVDRGGPTPESDSISGESASTESAPTPSDTEADPSGADEPAEEDGTVAAGDPESTGDDQASGSATESTRKPLPKPIHKAGSGSCVKSFAVGDKVKGFKLPSLAGDKTISPAGYRNRVVLLNFWATWCKPCLAELPEFDRLYRKYRSHGLTLVAVTTDEDAKPVQDFVDEHKLVAKIALAGEAAAGQYNRSQFPFSFVVDGEGTIIASFDFVDDACLGDLEQVIRESLEQLD